MLFVGFTLLTFVSRAWAHGSMNIPRPRASQGMDHAGSFPMFVGGEKSQCAGDACLWYQVGCYIGCDHCSCLNKEMYPTPQEDGNCTNPSEPTLPLKARSWNPRNKSPKGDFTKYNPWRSPGKAPVQNPCGVASGFHAGWKGAEIPMVKDGPSTFPAYMFGTELPPLKNYTKPVYKKGSNVTVSWGIAANHGGGYSYRLCPLSEKPTEACFQKYSMPFLNEETVIHYPDGSRADITIPSVTVTGDVVTPKGSTWKRNPVPACNCDLGFGCSSSKGSEMTKPYEIDPEAPTKYKSHQCLTGLQFPAAWDDGYGDGGSCLYPVGSTKPCDPFKFNMVDEVGIPDNAEPGDYLLSFRWDCEQTSQVWTQCADVTIVA